jgi:hypothetical protein
MEIAFCGESTDMNNGFSGTQANLVQFDLSITMRPRDKPASDSSKHYRQGDWKQPSLDCKSTRFPVRAAWQVIRRATPATSPTAAYDA